MESIPNNRPRVPRHKPFDRFLRRKRIEEILIALANVPDLQTFMEKPDFETHLNAVKSHLNAVESYRSRWPEVFGMLDSSDVIPLRDLIRKAWIDPDHRQSEWFLFQARLIHEKGRQVKEIGNPDELAVFLDRETKRARYVHDLLTDAKKFLDKPIVVRARLAHLTTIKEWWEAGKVQAPPLVPFEEVLFHLQENLDRTLRCKNPECATPYFFLNRKGQEYCSPDCVGWGKRERNKEWARKNREKGRGK